MASKFSAAIKAGLTVKGLTQSELAAELDVAENTVSRWVKDRCLPDRESIFNLKKFCGWDDAKLTYLLEDWYENNRTETNYHIAGPEYVKWRYDNDYVQFLDDLVKLDYEIIDGLHMLDEGTAEQWAPIFESTNEMWRIILHQEEIVGYWSFVFIKKEFFDKIRSGELKDSMIRVDMLELPLSSGDYFAHLAMGSLLKNHQKSPAYDCLLKSIVGAVAELTKHNRYFKALSAHAFVSFEKSVFEKLGFKPDGEHQNAAGETVDRYLIKGEEMEQTIFAQNDTVQRKYRKRFN